jgi:tetratricopeptide (TPR) repeat protein
LSTSDRGRSPVATAIVAALLLAGAATARAAESDTNRAAAELARGKAVEAEKLYEERDYRAALRKLEEAFALYPSPKIHYNFGLVHRALLREVEALEAFEKFLAEASDAGAEDRATATRHVAELRAAVGVLEITCDTAGAEVFVDGRSGGTTPLARALRVAPGPHQVVIHKAGVPFPYTQRIDAVAGAVVRVDARLEPILQALRAAATSPAAAAGADRAAATDPLSLSLSARPGAPGPAPLHRRPWFWVAAGGVVAAAVITTLVLVAGKSDDPLCGAACGLGTFNVDAR